MAKCRKNKIDNSSVIDIYSESIDRIAIGYAENTARNLQLKVFNCPGFELGIRILCIRLIKNNLVDPKELFEYLKKHSYRDFDDIIEDWWKVETTKPK